MGLKMPCVICCSPVQDNLNVEDKDKLFQWFLMKFRVARKGRGQKNKRVERFDLLLKDKSIGWDGQGGKSPPLPFCGECNLQLTELMAMNVELYRAKVVPEGFLEIKRKMRESEEEFERCGIYDKDKRYQRVRRFIIMIKISKLGMMKRKAEGLSGEDKLCEDEVVVKEEVQDDPDWRWDDEEPEIQVNLADISEQDPLGPDAGATNDNDNHHRNCLLCYKAISKEESALAPVLTNDLNEQNFNSMFILRKMLEIPKETLAGYLVKFSCPGKWVEYCKNCLYLVDASLRIEKDIKKLEDKLRNCQEKMVRKIKSTFEKRRKLPGYLHVTRVTEESRQFVAKQVYKIAVGVTSGYQDEDDRPLLKPPPPPPPPRPWSHLDNIDQSSDHDHVTQLKLSSPEKKPELSIIEQAVTQLGDKREVKFEKILKGGSYTCPSCPHIKIAMSLAEYHSHLLFHNQRPFKCSTCNLYWSGPKELENNPFVKEPPSSGHLCSEATLVKFPQDKYSPGNIWECDWCPDKFEVEGNRDSHEDSEHSCLKSKLTMKYKCLSCTDKKKEYRSYREWLLHRALEHPEVARISCLYCDFRQTKKVFQTKEGIEILNEGLMRKHATVVHSVSARCQGMDLLLAPESCDFCGSAEITLNLKDHVKDKHNLRDGLSTYSCPCCWGRFGTVAELKKHIYLEHKSTETKAPRKPPKKDYSVICDICGRKAQNKGHLADHKLVKHGIEPEDEGEDYDRRRCREIFSCKKSEECGGFRTLSKPNMKEHMMKKHGAERKWKCEECGKAFTDRRKLKRHTDIHKNKRVKPFQCEICGNSFAVKNYLYIHMRLSHQNRPFASTNKKRVRKVGTPAMTTTTTTGESGMERIATKIINYQGCQLPPPPIIEQDDATVVMDTN